MHTPRKKVADLIETEYDPETEQYSVWNDSTPGIYGQ